MIKKVGTMALRFEHDDEIMNVVGKINEALKKHDLVIEFDNQAHDGFMLAELIKKAPSLEILSAKYYAKGIVRDVRAKIVEKIKDGTLNFVILNDDLGGDPLYGASKTLAIVYKHNNEIKAVELSEGQTVILP